MIALKWRAWSSNDSPLTSKRTRLIVPVNANGGDQSGATGDPGSAPTTTAPPMPYMSGVVTGRSPSPIWRSPTNSFPFDGAPLRYRPTANGYTLYSIGLNQLDDGGMSGDRWSGDIVFTVTR